MNDQAQGLRNLLQPDDQHTNTRIITVTSGKGGVGKSNFTLNFALTLQEQGYKVLIFDADIGMANIDVLMGVRAEYNLYHLLKRQKTLQEIICRGHNDLQFIAGGSGFQELLQLTDDELDYFAKEVIKLNGSVDFIIFDTGAGLSKETLKFIVSAQQTIVVTTPEPTAITDAYALIKMVHKMNLDIDFQMVVNRVTDHREGLQTSDKISLVAKRFLGLDIPSLGFVADDAMVSKSVKKQMPFTVAFPGCNASKGMKQLVQTFLSQHNLKVEDTSGIRSFLNKFVKLIK